MNYTWKRVYKADLQTEEYAFTMSRLYHYYYPLMSDCVKPTCEPMEEYQAEVTKWRKDRYGHVVADHCCEGYRTGSIDKDTANKIYWNIKNRNISFAECKRYFTELAGRELRS